MNIEALTKFLMKSGRKAKALGGKALEMTAEHAPEAIGTGLGVAGGEVLAHHANSDDDDEEKRLRRELLLKKLGLKTDDDT